MQGAIRVGSSAPAPDRGTVGEVGDSLEVWVEDTSRF